MRARESAALFRQLGQPQFQQYPLVCAALALALTGQPAEAEDALREWEGLGLPPSFFNYADDQQARAWTAAAAGDQPQAQEILREASDKADAIGDLIGEAALLHSLARLGGAGQVADRLDKVAAAVEGELTRARAAHVRALAAGDPEGLEAAATTFERLGALLPGDEPPHALESVVVVVRLPALCREYQGRGEQEGQQGSHRPPRPFGYPFQGQDANPASGC